MPKHITWRVDEDDCLIGTVHLVDLFKITSSGGRFELTMYLGLMPTRVAAVSLKDASGQAEQLLGSTARKLGMRFTDPYAQQRRLERHPVPADIQGTLTGLFADAPDGLIDHKTLYYTLSRAYTLSIGFTLAWVRELRRDNRLVETTGKRWENSAVYRLTVLMDGEPAPGVVGVCEGDVEDVPHSE